MSTRVLLTRVLLALGLTFLAGGLLLGFLPRKAGWVHCGSAFHATRDADVADLGRTFDGVDDGLSGLSPYATACESTRSATRIPAIILLIVGAGVTLSGAVAGSPLGEPISPSGRPAP